MAVPSMQTMLRPVLQAAADGACTSDEYRAAVIKWFGLSDADVSEILPSGRQTRLANRVYWSCFHLQRASLLTRVRRGVYEITDRGHQALRDQPNPMSFESLDQYPEHRAWRRGFQQSSGSVENNEPASTEEETTPEERIEALVKEVNAGLADDLLRRTLENSWQFFEQVVIDTLVAMGYGGGRQEMASAFQTQLDGGIDGIINQDPLGLDIVYVQAKRYALNQTIGRPEIQNFSGALDGKGAHKGVFVTTAAFADTARQFAESINKRLILVDGPTLARHMIDHGVGVRVQTTYALHAVDEDYFSP